MVWALKASRFFNALIIHLIEIKESVLFMPKVIAVCGVVTDHLVHVDHLPKPNGGATILDESWQGGGNSATAIAAVGAQGVDAGIITCVGNDDYGVAQIVDFQKFGVDTSQVIVREGYETPVNMCMSDEETNGRSFIGKRRPFKRIEADELNMDYVNSASYLLIDSNSDATKKAAQAILDKGGEVLFDASGFSETQEAMLPYTTVYITSEFYLRDRYGLDANVYDCCREMIAKGPHTVIFTLGEHGCKGVGPDGEFELPAFKVEKIIDTTGAGDTFHGAYIVGMTRGLNAKECARWASATSAHKIAAIGGRAGQPTAEEVDNFIKTGIMDLSYVPARVEYYKKLHFSLDD
jgi:sugar/nucleoside kinase (ribokinase family)